MPHSAFATSRVWAGYCLAIVAYALLFSFWQVEVVPWDVHLAGIALAAICFFPMRLWFSRGAGEVPMFEVLCLAYALQFSVPLYLEPNALVILNDSVTLRWDDVFRALLISILGVSAMIAGYYIIRSGKPARNLPRIDLPLAPARRTQYLVLAFALGLGGMLLQLAGIGGNADSSFGAIIRLLAMQFSTATVILAYQVYNGRRRSPALALTLYGLVAVAVLLGLATGLLENALIPLVLLFIVRWHATHSFPWWFLVGGFALFVVLTPVKNQYRDQVWYGTGNYTLSERIDLWATLGLQSVQNVVSGDILTTSGPAITQAMARFDLLHKFAYVQAETPSVVPYYNGATYGYFLYAWVPRVVWPDKPSASTANNTVDVDYGFLYSFQTGTTNIGIGQLPEAFANFGVLGVIFIMLLQGLLFGTLDRALNNPHSDGGRAIYLSIMVFFLNGIGSSAAILFGAIIQYTIASVLILRIFATGFTSGQKARRPERKPWPGNRQPVTLSQPSVPNEAFRGSPRSTSRPFAKAASLSGLKDQERGSKQSVAQQK
jgi:hypothetical protein